MPDGKKGRTCASVHALVTQLGLGWQSAC